jgi:L-asparaginase II
MIDPMAGEILAEVTRSGLVESHHNGHLILLDADGSIRLSIGDTSLSTFPRSAIKSIQASAMVRSGMQLEPRLLALVAASHSGSSMHQSGVKEILELAGLEEGALQNALDRPLGEEDRREWGSKSPTSLAQNCSGKHAGMLLTCVFNSWPTANYLDPEHPLQVACRRELEDLSGEEVSLVSTDGCGAPLFVITLLGLARAIWRITISTDPVHQRVLQACRDFPEMVAGEGRLTTRKMREIPGLFIKEGAEGVQVGSMPDGRTFVFKVNDGSARANGVLVVAALEKLGIHAIPEDAPIYGGKKIVGSISANF